MIVVKQPPPMPQVQLGPEWRRISGRVLDGRRMSVQVILNALSIALSLVTLEVASVLQGTKVALLDPTKLGSPSLEIFAILGSWILPYWPIVLLHELVHAKSVPRPGTVYLVASLSALWSALKAFPRIVPGAYVIIFAEVPKGRMIQVILAPFILLTVAPLALMWVTGIWFMPIVTISAINSIMCARDLVQALVIGIEVSNKGTVYFDYYRV